MKGKFLFAAAFAALAVGCSQEELEAPVVADFDLSGRIGIQAPAMSLGNGVETRMTTDGSQAAVKWQENDGFGAMLVDQVNSLASKKWDERYTITNDYKQSNFLFRYNSTTETFNTDAAMVEGNYVFYAPFNSAENTRQSLTIKTPVEQTITPDVVNSAVTKFYESGDPVFIAYKELRAESAETSIDVQMKHIFATPLITLTNKYTTPDGEGNLVVKHNLTVTKVEFTYANKFMATAQIKNNNVRSIFRTGGGDKNWEKNQHEKAHTSDLYDALPEKNKVTTITVNMDGDGLTITPGQSKQFAVILPAENYGANLKATVYVKIDGKEEGKFFERVSTKSGKTLCLNPGFPYPAEEYNADGSLKISKGTSATYELTATDLKDTPTVNPNEIKSEAELISYINNVAYRGQNISQVTTDVTDPGTQFKIKDDCTITLTDAFFNAVKNSILVNTAFGAVNGSVRFTDISKIQLGAITQDRFVDNHVEYAAGELTVVGNYTVQNGDNIVIKSGTVAVPKNIAYTITNDGGILNVAGAPNAASTITNKNTGIVNINGDTDANLTINNNGKATDPKQTSVIKIAAGKTVKSTIDNSANGKIINNGLLYGATGYVITNNGLIEVTDINAGIKIDGNGGNICNNVQCPYVTVSEGTVYCDLTSVPKSIAKNINTVNLSGTITFPAVGNGDNPKDNIFSANNVFAYVKTVNVANGTVITSNSMDGTALGVTFNFPTGDKETAYWNSVHAMMSISVTGFAKNIGGKVTKGTNVTLPAGW